MKKKILYHLVTIVTIFMMLFSCANPGLQGAFNSPHEESVTTRSYNYSDNMAPSQLPPGGLAASEVPQFVVFGFDDNYSPAEMRWVTDLFLSKSNPAGTGNVATYDGTPIGASFYHSTKYLAANRAEWSRAAAAGFETGNHTDSHPNGSAFSVTAWENEMRQCRTLLTGPGGVGVTAAEITGFRSPFLAYNTNTMLAIKKLGMLYDCSMEEGWQGDQDGTNFYWPYTLDYAGPGNINAKLDQNVNGLWEIPAYVVIVPPDEKCAQYGVPSGLRARLKARKPNSFSAQNGKITGFDWNLFFDYKMTKEEALATLKYTLDLRLSGNRAPLTFGTHSNYYDDPARKAVLAEFIDYALTKKDVRIVSGKQLLDWIRKPVALKGGTTTDTEAPGPVSGLAVTKATADSLTLSWQPASDNVGVKGYELSLNGGAAGTTGLTTFTFTGLSANTTYELAVVAFDAAGNRSLSSSIQGKTTGGQSGCSLPKWEAGKVYISETVSHNGRHWKAKWWNKEEPGLNSWGPWEDLGPCDGSTTQPKLTMVSPVAGAVYKVGQAIEINIDASSFKDVAQVEIFQGTTSLGTLTTAPYTLSWGNVAAGSYQLKAVATDSKGQKISSQTISIKVESGNTSGTTWAAGVTYEQGSVVTYNSKQWLCKFTHTSNSAIAPGTPGLWFWEELK